MSRTKNNAQCTVEANIANQSHGLTGNDSSGERKFQGAEVSGSELARVLLELSLRERIGPGAKRLGTDVPRLLAKSIQYL